MLGIIIGISSVIAIMSIGDSLTGMMSETMSSLGANNITVQVVTRDSEDSNNANAGFAKIDDMDLLEAAQIDEFAETYSNDVLSVAYTSNGGSGKAKNGHLYANVNITGVNDGYLAVQNLDLLKGRFITSRDLEGSRNVAIVSDKLVDNMFRKGQDPLGQEVDIDTNSGIQTYNIVGVYKYDTVTPIYGGGSTSDKDVTTDLYVPVSVVQQTAENQNFSNFTIKTKTTVDNTAFTPVIEKYFDRLYATNTIYKCSVTNMESMMEQATSMMGTLKIAIMAIAAIALLVGGIGVMNIMLVSVTERTREIGTRKALGAKSAIIKMQFIIESMIICAIGGILGTILGITLGAVVAIILGTQFTISIPAILISVGFSMLIGVFFGFYPANKAAKMDPIEALRYE